MLWCGSCVMGFSTGFSTGWGVFHMTTVTL
nr:MAG TPA: hypothetical protein [Caudoviricetes sp.]